jgi:MFS family permease
MTMANAALFSARGEPAPPIQRPPAGLLLAISFAGGFSIMVLEICGLRVLATYLGSSVFVTGTLLSVYMVLLSVGYYAGGLLSSRWGRAPRALFGSMLGAALYAGLLHALCLDSIGTFGSSVRDGLEGQPFLQPILPAALLTVILYGPPVLVLSMISPFLIRLRASPCAAGAAAAHDSASDAGVQAGFFMSLSTIGSIVGTMLSSYVSVPMAGVRWTVLVASAGLFTLVSVAWLRTGPPLPRARRLGAAGSFAALLLGLVSSGFRSVPPDPNLVYRAESHYGELEVYQAEDDAGRRLLTYHPSRVYMHSMLFPEQPLWDLEGDMYFMSGLVQPPRNVLVLGSAAGGALRGLELAFPGAQLVGVDLDPKVHEVATAVFGVNPRVARLVTADARVFLAESRETFDLIIVDLFAGEFIPSHCISREFFELVRRRLSARGSVFINTNMNDIPFEVSGGSEPFRGVRHLQATLRAAGLGHMIENAFFNSIYAFAQDMPIERFRAGLEHEWRRGDRPAPLRAAAGLALYSSFAVADEHLGYKPFTDAWTPDFLIELKGNEGAIYAALERDGTAAVLDASAPATERAPRAVLERLLSQHFAEWRGSHDKGFVSVGALADLLGDVTEPLGPGALDVAARYLQFAHEPDLSELSPRGSWAELAALYGRMHALGHQNQHQALLEVLDSVHTHLSSP